MLLGRANWQAAADVTLENLAAGNSIGEACGGSVAARGLMWGNSHSAPKRWLPLKGPAWFNVNKALQHNTAEMRTTGSMSSNQL